MNPSENNEPTWHRRLLHWILPAQCLACNESLWEIRDSLGLCPSCRDRLDPWTQSACRCCGKPLAAASSADAKNTDDAEESQGRCLACLNHPPPVDRLLCAWNYAPPLDSVLTGFKFRRLDYLGEDLGRALARRFTEPLQACDAVAAVPLHWRRRFSRGYDQAELLARTLAEELHLEYVRPLRRLRATPPQSRLPREERRHNLRQAFGIRGKTENLRGQKLVLVDDVTTTGATLHAAAACLKQAGIRSVTAVTAGRTPADRGESLGDRPESLKHRPE